MAAVSVCGAFTSSSPTAPVSAGSASAIVIAPSATARRQGQSAGASATAASTIPPTLSTPRSAATATAAGIILRPGSRRAAWTAINGRSAAAVSSLIPPHWA